MKIFNSSKFKRYFYNKKKIDTSINYNLPLWFQSYLIILFTSILTPFSVCGSFIFILSWIVWEIGYYIYKRFICGYWHDYHIKERIIVILVSILVRELIIYFSDDLKGCFF